ncbi:hypothetical protein Ppb6_01860 [Photorhabdus australis subsp. thailandensis]|uniref:Uncharacterized protein n=1 Tax=Photorhabdus australis subsp. thailandensis TaxID=2805096 RepID=A0A1C0U4W1_9GAMM|nr:hypothetical protein Ppb6_01860 [Photorhabdus australis subsp. thailandensis]
MMFNRFSTAILLLSLLSTSVFAEKPQNFLYTSSDNLNQLRSLLERQDINGVQIIYNWKQLESAPGKYDFSAIEKDLESLSKIQKSCLSKFKIAFLRKMPAISHFTFNKTKNIKAD